MKSSSPGSSAGLGSGNGPAATTTNRAVTSLPFTFMRQRSASSSQWRSPTSLLKRISARTPKSSANRSTYASTSGPLA
ncbi:Uncharacterised protein [Mycobacteroides abscessus subsp. abscessus]|nr:Uncharacterised protein [Mycobacteroides abscessus subsp. abscessus]